METEYCSYSVLPPKGKRTNARRSCKKTSNQAENSDLCEVFNKRCGLKENHYKRLSYSNNPERISKKKVKKTYVVSRKVTQKPVVATQPKSRVATKKVAQAKPAVAAKVQPKPAVAVQAQPKPVVANQTQPKPAVAVQAQPKPAVAVQAQPKPAVAVQAQAKPVVAVQAQPKPAVAVQAQPKPAVAVQAQPKPAVAVQAQPKPAVAVQAQAKPVVAPYVFGGPRVLSSGYAIDELTNEEKKLLEKNGWNSEELSNYSEKASSPMYDKNEYLRLRLMNDTPLTPQEKQLLVQNGWELYKYPINDPPNYIRKTFLVPGIKAADWHAEQKRISEEQTRMARGPYGGFR